MAARFRSDSRTTLLLLYAHEGGWTAGSAFDDQAHADPDVTWGNWKRDVWRCQGCNDPRARERKRWKVLEDTGCGRDAPLRLTERGRRWLETVLFPQLEAP